MIVREARPLAVHVGEITSRMEADSNGGGVAAHFGAQAKAPCAQRPGSAENGDAAPIRPKLAADARQLAEQRVEHVARSIRVGEQLAVALLVKRDADFAEEGDRLVDGKRAEDAPDDRRSAAPEIAFGDVDVGDVAARSAADQDFCAGFLRAVEDDDGTGRVRSPEEDGGRKAGGAGADDDYVVPCHSTAKRRKSAAKPRIIDSMPDPCAGLAGAPIARSS